MILDIVVILSLLLSMLIGYKIGILRYILKLASIFSALIITCVLITPIHSFSMNSSIGQNKIDEIYVQIEGYESTSEMLDALNSPQVLTFIFEKIIQPDSENTNLALDISTSIASKIIWVQCFIIIFIIFVLSIFIIKQIVRRIRENPTVRLVDGLGGIVFSVMTFQLISYIILSIILSVANFGLISGVADFFTLQNNESIGIFSYFYEQNYIYNFIELFF